MFKQLNYPMKPVKLIIAILFFSALQSYAQQYDALIKKFYGSVLNATTHVEPKAVAATIKIDVGAAGNVAGIELSDGADPVFAKPFYSNKSRLDMAALKQYVKLRKLKNVSLFIPYYVIDKQNKDIASNGTKQLMRFKDKDFTGKSIMLDPIKIYFSITKS